MKPGWFLIGSVAALLATSDPSVALHEAPLASCGLRWEPYAFAYNVVGEPFDSVAGEYQDYYLTEYIQAVASDCPTTTLTIFLSELSTGGNGLIFIYSHGNDEGFVVEAYDKTAAAAVACSVAFDEYLGSGFTGYDPFWCPDGQIFIRQDTAGYRGIAVRPAFVGAAFDASRNTLVHTAVCYSYGWAATAWPGARCVLGYPAASTTYTADTWELWARMNGRDGKEARQAGVAKNTTSLSLYGSGNTVLSPCVLSVSPAEFSTIEGTTLATVAFDTRMETISLAPNVRSDGMFYTSNVAWTSESTLVFNISPKKRGWGDIRIRAESVAALGYPDAALLDGNEDPLGSDGEGPNRDDYVYALYSNDEEGSAATVTARRDGAGLSWVASREDLTMAYRVLGMCEPGGMAGEVIADVVPARGSGSTYRCDVPGDYAWLLLQEKEVPGRRASEWNDVCMVGPLREAERGRPPVLSSDLLSIHVVGLEHQRSEIERYVESKRTHGFKASYEIVGSLTEGRIQEALRRTDCLEIIWRDRPRSKDREEEVLIVAPPDLESPVEAYADELRDHGFDSVRIEYVDYPTTHDSTHVALLTEGDEHYILLMGDVLYRNEDVGNAIPLPYVYDPNYEFIWSDPSYNFDYALSLWDYETVGGASSITKAVGFLPAYETIPVWIFLQKMTAAYWNGFYGGYGSKMGAWAYDLDCSGNPGDAVHEAMQMAVDSLSPQWEVDEFYASDDPWGRYAHVMESLLDGRSIVAMLATGSKCDDVCEFLHLDLDYDTLESSWKLSHFLPLSCMAQPVDLPNNGGGPPDWGPPCSMEKLLWTHQGGALSSIGPTRGYYSPENFYYLQEYLRQLDDARDTVCVGDLHASVRNALLDSFPGDTLMAMYCKINVLLGDPTLPVFGPLSDPLVGVTTGGDGPARGWVFLGAARPNPFNPSTTIPFTLASGGKANLSVFDIAGRLVRVLVDTELPAGSHSAVWDGRTEAGHEAGSGAYSYRLQLGEKTETRRMVLLR